MVNVDLIAFDADDTLWHSQSHFHEAHLDLMSLLAPFCDFANLEAQMRREEERNVAVFGYGVKAFTLALIEAGLEVTDGTLPPATIREIITVARRLMAHSVELLPGVEQVVKELSRKYKLIVITKGDSMHQENKLLLSGLAGLFFAIEIVAQKSTSTYTRIATKFLTQPSRMVMVGNSMRSDVLPALAAGCYSAFIPYPDTWEHEIRPPPLGNPRYTELLSISDVPGWIATLSDGR